MTDIIVHAGPKVRDAIPAVSALRRAVFREWPYLYDGDAESEAAYMAGFAEARDALVVLAVDAASPVGATTGCALEDHADGSAAPFEAHGIDAASTFYFAESVLLPGHRGRGIGHRFFDAREAFARERGYRCAVFCAVVRPPDHPARTAAARDLAPFWRARGYEPVAGLVTHMSWRDIGADAETAKPLQFWSTAL